MCRFEATNIYATMNEVERVLAIKDGDHQAFINLYNEYWSQVYDFSRLYITTIADEDENIKGFLFIVTRNIVFNRHKKKVNENLLKTSVLSAFGHESYYNSTSVEEDYCASQLKIFIDKLINSLPEQQRKCFLLSREENLSYREIAERLGISQKTVEIHMSKALKFLKDKVKRGWEILLSLLSF